MYTPPERTEEERMNTFQLVFWDQCYPATKTGEDIRKKVKAYMTSWMYVQKF